MKFRKNRLEFLEIMALTLGTCASLMTVFFSLITPKTPMVGFYVYSSLSICALSYVIAYAIRIIIGHIKK